MKDEGIPVENFDYKYIPTIGQVMFTNVVKNASVLGWKLTKEKFRKSTGGILKVGVTFKKDKKTVILIFYCFPFQKKKSWTWFYKDQPNILQEKYYDVFL